MRTSRVSRDTANLVNALSSSSRTPTRRSLRHNPLLQGLSPELIATPDIGIKDEDSTSSITPTSTKRKRDIKPDPDAPPSPPDVKIAPPRRQPAKRIKGPNGQITVTPPTNWEQVYTITSKMRSRILAPVDTMGCEDAADATASPLDKRLQTLIALMLSSQTKDPVTFAAMRALSAGLPGGFNLAALLRIAPPDLNALICKVGFHNNKTKYIKATAEILRDRFGGDIPDTIEGLTSLPGVGPKMAYLCMSAAWGRDEGIGVDVHVHRITNLWGWHKTSNPEQTRAELEAWLPRDKWHDINHLLVGFGQMVCLPVGRRCGECELATLKLCPSRVAGSPAKKKAKREVVKEEENVVQVEVDDVGIKVEADLEDEGHLEAHGLIGQ